MRLGSLYHSTTTRSLASACFTTNAGFESGSTSTVRFDTPPCRISIHGVSSPPIKPCSRRYGINVDGVSISNDVGDKFALPALRSGDRIIISTPYRGLLQDNTTAGSAHHPTRASRDRQHFIPELINSVSSP